MGEVDKGYISDTIVLNRDVYESVMPSDGKEGVLKVIKGPVAEWDKLNRNKRRYSEKLWDKVLDAPYVKEQMRYRTLYGEANHPTDRYEVDFSRVSHLISDMWKVPSTNQIYATIEILDTPLGRILNTLYDAGGVIGYSSRAGGSIINKKGYSDVDENTYNFITFDAVPFPSVESARPPIVEGVEMDIPKTSLSEGIHDKLCRIISESTNKEKEVIKDLIYNLKGYDLEKEISILEGVPYNNLNRNYSKEETTMSLLRESSLQIDRLRSENKTLQTTKSTLEEENKNLRDNLNSSLINISKLMNESKNLKENNKPVRNYDDTIKVMENRINELDGEIQERDLEINRLRGVEIAFRSVNEEKKGLQYEINSLREGIEKQSSQKNTELEKELNEAYNEVSSLIKESKKKDYRISELTETVEGMKEKISMLESCKDSMEEKCKLVNESVTEVKNLGNENEMLKRQIDEMNESMEDVEKRYDYCKNELISVIASGYNLDAKLVREKLPVGFTKSDVYNICESMSNSITRVGYYPNILEESSESNMVQRIERPSPRVDFVDRRGRS